MHLHFRIHKWITLRPSFAKFFYWKKTILTVIYRLIWCNWMISSPQKKCHIRQLTMSHRTDPLHFFIYAMERERYHVHSIFTKLTLHPTPHGSYLFESAVWVRNDHHSDTFISSNSNLHTFSKILLELER